ncbi:MAG: UTP--glucose-1-phosphate uridylyltransferase GalU [Burkholderiales bacterium]
MRKITKAVFPVAGLGTRFLPATKASPKEMLPVVDKPLIQYAVEEAVAAGITQMVFVTGRTKRAIEDHFDRASEMESELKARGKETMLEMIREMIPREIVCIYVRQAEPLGLGHAVLCAQPVVGDEPFAVILADDLIDAETPVMAQMTELYKRFGCTVLGIQQVAREETSQYGIIKGREISKGLHGITGIVEKPKPEAAPSLFGVVGRYILSPRVFELLSNVQRGAGGEIQLTDAIASLLEKEEVMGYEFAGTRYDCGSKLGYLKANLGLALKHPEIGKDFKSYLQSLGCRLD